MVPKKSIPPEIVRDLISKHFTRKEVAKLLGVSLITLKRRMALENIKVSDTYAAISDLELQNVIKAILEEHPNTGIKVMVGFLRGRGLKIQRNRVEEAMRVVDPIGVQCRKSASRVIARRVYFVKYSNEIWHIDTNLKLIRWKFVIKGAIDGKSRCCIYLDVADNNTSSSQLRSFEKGVRDFGVPLRTRSDKGLENRGIAEFMLRNRGLGRGSHICGRSVHNQRIERFWVDVYAKVILQYVMLFSTMEHEGILDLENDLHISLLHHVFIPRIQFHLQSFREGWNNHGISTERNKSPNQLMLLHLPPAENDLCLADEIVDITEFSCNDLTDATYFNVGSALTQPNPPRFVITDEQLAAISLVNISGPSPSYGLDMFTECLAILTATC